MKTSELKLRIPLHPFYDEPAEIKIPTPSPKCQTCNDRGEIGGFVSADSGYQTDPCPDCSIAGQASSVPK